jgi:asparagine synthase (glutamine-hydrolysing)
MCGIAGIVGLHNNDPVDAADVHRMCETIVHRGPDDEGIYARGRAGLGMRRLSIIDLSTGRQPIHNEDRTIWVVFNGEIYNFSELRLRLQERGHRFYTNTDTEVIVHLYEEYGPECVHSLRGMFAFAVWDERKQRLLLARDRLGKKPLHYAITKGRLLFGSEIKAVLAGGPDLTNLDANGLLNFFHFGYIPDPLTAFSQIHKLAPGHLLEMSGGEIRVRQYWDLPKYGVYEPKSEGECLEGLEHHLSTAVQLRLASDVPLGALLSGGVDSSVVVAMMARFSSRKVKTFSIGFANQDFNEAEHARAVAQHFGTEHHEIIVEPDIEKTLNELTCSLEEPFGDSSMVPTFHVCRMARQHVTVALAGDGGDELFAGYDRYQSHLRRSWIHLFPPGTGNWYRTHIHPHVPTGWPGRRFVFNLSLASRERYLDGISLLPACLRERSLFATDFVEWADSQASPYDRFRRYFDGRTASDSLSELLYLDAKTYLPGDILTKVDRMSMATSLEVRAPLLDHRLVEWAARLSPSWKLRGGESKYILKRLAERLGVPRQVLYRRKQGFSMPLVHWFRAHPMPALLELLLEPRTIQRGYFNRRELERRIREHRDGIRDRAWELWHLLVFELWHRNFLEQATHDRSAAMGWARPRPGRAHLHLPAQPNTSATEARADGLRSLDLLPTAKGLPN